MRKSGLSLAVALLVCSGSAFAQEDANTTKNFPEKKSIDVIDVFEIGATEFQRKNAPASVSVITAEDIEKNNYRDVLDALSDVVGVNFRGSINIRGIGSGTIMLVDGKPRKTLQWDNTSPFPPLNQIERIEVIRGSTGALYGNALGGVVNVITKKVSKEWGLNANQYFSLYQNKLSPKTSIYASGPLINDVLGLNLGLEHEMHTNNYIINKNKLRDTKGRELTAKKFDAKLNWIIDKNNELALLYSYSNLKNEIADVFTEPTKRDFTRIVPEENIFNLEHIGKYGKLETNTYIQGGFSTYDYKEAESNEDTISFRDKQKELIFHTQGKYNFESNTLNFGYEYKDTKYNTTGKELRLKANSFFITDDYYLTDSLSLSLGGRFDINNNFANHFSPRAYVVYSQNEEITIKGGVSAGYKNPEYWQILTEPFEGNKAGHINFVSLPNPSLKPETSINYEIGFNYTDEKKGFDFTTFYIDYKDKIENKVICKQGDPWDVNDIPNWGCDYKGQKVAQISEMTNLSKVKVYGVELTTFYQILENLRASVNFSYISGKEKKNERNVKYWPAADRTALSVKLDYAPITKLNLWAKYTNAGKQNTRKGWSAYQMTDLGLAYQYNKNVSITAAVYNAFNKNIDRSWTDNARGVNYTMGVNIRF